MLIAGKHHLAEQASTFIPFLSAVKPAAPTTYFPEPEEIEVDVELQQALAQSMAVPSPGKALHSKGNALHDISNWRLPVQAGMAAAAEKQPASLGLLQTGQTLLGTFDGCLTLQLGDGVRHWLPGASCDWPCASMCFVSVLAVPNSVLLAPCSCCHSTGHTVALFAAGTEY